MGGPNETVMRSTPHQTTLLSVQYGTDYLVEICRVCLRVVEVSVILSACTQQTDIKVVMIAAGLPLSKQDKDLPETLPEPMYGIRHKKQGKCPVVHI